MITFLRGELAEKQPTRVVIDVGGVGHEVLIPLSTYDNLPLQNEICQLLTYDHVREDQHVLFGFGTESERRMFTMLLSISGVGPKLALSTLSGVSVRQLTEAVADGDCSRLTAVPGIGKKTAQRIVMELQHKIGENEALENVAGLEGASAEDITIRDAILALISLGYKQVDARKAVKKALEADSNLASVEEIVRKALT